MKFGKDDSDSEKKPSLIIAIGKGKSPSEKPPKLSKLMGMDSDSPTDATDPTSNVNAPDASSTGPATIPPESAQFHDQSSTCSSCKYFDQDGANGMGECTKGVQVDFSSSDPQSSWCRFYEAGSHEGEESPATESGEEMGGKPPIVSKGGMR